MTWILAGISIAGSAFSVIGQSSAARAQAGSARVQANAAAYEGELDNALRGIEASDITREAAAEADQIRRAAMLQRGQIVVAQSQSGTVIGEGSSQAAIDQLETLASADALAALYSGVNRSTSTRASGQYAAKAGSNRSSALTQASRSYSAQGSAAVLGGLANIGGALAKGYLKEE